MKIFQNQLNKLIRLNKLNFPILNEDGDIGTNSKKVISALNDLIQNNFSKRGWKAPFKDLVYLRLDYTLTDTFDDIVVRYNNGVIDYIAPCSTTAGSFYIKNPITYGGIKGTAIAKEQQILGSHRFFTSANWKSLWLGGPYFQQEKSMDIYRDGNLDNKLDKVTLQKGLFGINLHHAGYGNTIYNWSAGCLVTQMVYWKDIISIFKNGEVLNFNLLEL